MELLVQQMEEQKKRSPKPLEKPVHKQITPILIRRNTTSKTNLSFFSGIQSVPEIFLPYRILEYLIIWAKRGCRKVVLTGIPFIDCIILFHMIFFSYFANNPAWISSSQTIWRNIPCHNTSCSYYTSLSYGNTATNNHIGCQPAIIFYSNWFRLFKIIKASIFSFSDITFSR